MHGQRVALVTGCSTGIGRDLAGRLAKGGYALVATARRVEALDTIGAAMKLRLDVTDTDSAKVAVERVMREYGRIDVLVNNAGFAASGAVEEIKDESLRAMFDVNFFGAAMMMRLVSPIMRAQGSGTIVNVSSIAGRMATPVGGGYCATKFALEAISDAARQELRPFGVKVVLVEPGPIRTAFDDTNRAFSAGLASDGDSPYADLYASNEALTGSIRGSEPGPEAVSKVILKILRTGRPRARYYAGVPTSARLLIGMRTGIRDSLYGVALKGARRKPA